MRGTISPVFAAVDERQAGRLELMAVKARVEALALEQLVMGAVLDEPALFEHEDRVGVGLPQSVAIATPTQ